MNFEFKIMKFGRCKSRGPKSGGRFITIQKPDAEQLQKMAEVKRQASFASKIMKTWFKMMLFVLK